MLTVGSLFAGIGGFDGAFRRAGLRTAWAVEKDPDARRVLAARFPGAALHEDVRGHRVWWFPVSGNAVACKGSLTIG